MNHRALATCLAAALVAPGLSGACRSASARPLDHVFRSGDDGYQCFRIPAIVSTNAGALLAFAEGRKNGCRDTGDIDLVVKRSDDGGVTWTLGGSTPTDQVNESTVAELGDGTLMLNMRAYTSLGLRQVSLSRDGGATWTAPTADAALIEPVCQASLLWSEHGGRAPFLAFSNPASRTSRANLTVRVSDNDGRSWERQLAVHEGPAAYSNLVTLPDGNLAILFEAGAKSPYEGIAFRELPIQRFERARPPAPGETPYEQHLEIRTSRIPHAGNGVFTRAPIPKGAYLGAYTGEFITEEEFLRRAGENRWQYMMGLLDCAKPHSNGLVTIDGIDGNVFTRMNYAPPEFQNVRFEKICEAPFVRIVALRDIAAGEELWVDYGPRYRYDFMEDPAVMAFFANLRAQRPKKDGSGRLLSPLR